MQINKNHLIFLNLLIYILPLSFILGNLVLNLNLAFLIIYSIALFRIEIFKWKFSIIDYLTLFFFSYILLNGVYNNFFNLNISFLKENNIVLVKSISFLRFLLLYFIIKFLILKNIVNFKYLFLIFGLICLFVSVDVIIQFQFGKDLFGFEGMGRRMPGPFNNEAIAGTFIQRFFVFLPYFILIYLNKNKLSNKFFLFLVIVVGLIGAVLAGNRMPFAMILFTIGFLLILEKDLRKILLSIILIAAFSIPYLTKNPTEMRHHYKNFLKDSNEIIIYTKSKILNEKIEISNIHLKEIESGIFTWQESKLFGGGIKSFKWVCENIDRTKMLHLVSKKGRVNCNNHPHNYYIQLAAELGIIGLLTFIVLSAIIIIKFFSSLYQAKQNHKLNKLLLVFFIVFLNEIFPFRTSGSFFTTTNAFSIFFILPFVSGLIKLNEDINEK